MAYLIDTDLVIDHLADHVPATRLLDQLADAGVAISIVTYLETYQGVLESPDPIQAEAKFEVFLAKSPVISVSRETARRCAALRTNLKRQGKRVRPRALDLIIAATALEHGLTLVTRNRADYDDIPGLDLYWHHSFHR
ncbi:MAG: type II toxin-antitoxin system VapC family toxin [Thermomicrobiales bacterium]